MKQNIWGIVLGFLTTFFGILAIIEGLKLGYQITLDDSGVGFFPLLIGTCLVLCGLYQLLFGHLLKISCKPLGLKEKKTVASIFISLVLYASLISLIGYPESTLLFILFLTRLLGNGSWVYSLGASLAVSVIFTVVFKIWMQMPLPSMVLTAMGVY